MQYQLPKGTFDILPYGADEPWALSDLVRSLFSFLERGWKLWNASAAKNRFLNHFRYINAMCEFSEGENRT